jgi:hypothetical protein
MSIWNRQYIGGEHINRRVYASIYGYLYFAVLVSTVQYVVVLRVSHWQQVQIMICCLEVVDNDMSVVLQMGE